MGAASEMKGTLLSLSAAAEHLKHPYLSRKRENDSAQA